MSCFGVAGGEFGGAGGEFGDSGHPETPPGGFEPRPKRLAWSQQPNLYLEPKWLRYPLWWLDVSPQPLTRFPQTTPVGFEPTRGDPIGLAGRRLSRSAKVSLGTVFGNALISSFARVRPEVARTSFRTFPYGRGRKFVSSKSRFVSSG